MIASCNNRHSATAGFTLMEIVLAIALTSVVMYLLMTAIELYMVRVDSSRSRVESAQLARTLLDQIAADLTATRLYAPQSPAVGGGQGGGRGGAGGGQAGGGGGARNGGGASASGSGSASGFSSGGANGGGPSGGFGGSGGGSSGGGGSSALPSSDVQGIYGTIEQLRIDRAAYPNWQRAAREVMPEEPATVADMPVSVRYYLVDGTHQTSQQLAERGVSDKETTESASGLYREVYTTAALAGETDPLGTSVERDGAKLEFLAPEVVKMEIQYFDGTQLVDAWDSLEEGALPAGVEILLTIYEPSFQKSLEEDQSPQPLTGEPRYRENELVEYRRFVRMPSIAPAQPAEALLPVAGANGNNGGRQGGEEAGGQNNGGQGGQNNGGQGGQNGGGQGGGNDSP